MVKHFHNWETYRMYSKQKCLMCGEKRVKLIKKEVWRDWI